MEKKIEQGLREPHGSPPPHTSQFPWLVFCCEKSQTFCSITENTSSVCSIPELADKIVQNSCHGWLIISSKKGQFSLWNPTTFESINLPPLKRKTTGGFEICVLSSPPNHPDSTVFIFDRDIKSLWFCRLRGHHWFKQSYAKYKAISENSNLPDGIPDLSNYFSSPVSFNNKIYAITRGFMLQGVLVQFDLNKRNKVEVKGLGKLPLPHRKNSWHFRKDLVESCGELFVIYIVCRARQDQGQIIDVEIHKLDLGSMAWERVTSLPNRAFFLDSSERMGGSLSVTCSKALGNRIYFSSTKDCTVLSYHIEDRSLSTSLPCPDQQSVRGLTKWIMANRSMDIHGEEVKNIGKEANKSSEKEAEGRQERIEIVEKKSNGTKLVDLPLEILKSIYDRVPTIDYLNLRHASAVCRQVAPPLQFETAISRSENLSNSFSPWLVSLHQDGRLCTLSHPHISDRYNVHVPEKLQDAMLWHCKDGWLLVSNSRGDVHILSFFNPFTKRVKRYKKLVEEPLISLQIAFSAPPTSPNCVVVTIQVCLEETVLISIGRSKEEDWMVSHHVDNYHDFIPAYDNPIFSNGAFYFLGRHANVGVVRLQEEGCDWQVIDGPREIDPFFTHSFLAERDGQIFLVLTYEIGKNVRVLSLDLYTRSWNNVTNLGNHTLHVSKSSALFAVAKTSEAGNKIYFPRLYGDCLITYSMSTNSIQCCGTEDSLESYKCSTRPLHCGWISPQC